jgi:hypothetical protein
MVFEKMYGRNNKNLQMLRSKLCLKHLRKRSRIFVGPAQLFGLVKYVKLEDSPPKNIQVRHVQ